MKLERLRQMRISELAGRSLQEASKRLERMGVAGKRKSRLHAILKKPRSAGTLLNDFQKTAPVHFFEGIEGEQFLAIAAKQMPDFQDSVIAVAETVRHKRFDLLGYRGLYFGDPIDWHLDPISGKRSPRVHWSRIDPLDPDTVGDSKIIWELNRHQWFVRLGQAYFLTGDERYAETFVDAIQDWIEANPRGIGINWASSLEAALRIISWSWALCLFRRSENLCQKLFATIVMAIRNHAIHVEKYLSYYFSPNTHLTGEALGLFYAGVLFPELSSAQSWRALGEKILLAQIERQVYSDGVYFEQSTCYQRYTVEIYLHFLVLAKRNGWEVPAAVAEHVRRMVDFSWPSAVPMARSRRSGMPTAAGCCRLRAGLRLIFGAYLRRRQLTLAGPTTPGRRAARPQRFFGCWGKRASKHLPLSSRGRLRRRDPGTFPMAAMP